MEIINNSTRLSDEQFQELKKRMAEKLNEVLTELKLRPGETDIRQLSDADFKQAVYRYMNDTLNAYNLMIHTLLDIEIVLLESLPEGKKKYVKDKLDKIGAK